MTSAENNGAASDVVIDTSGLSTEDAKVSRQRQVREAVDALKHRKNKLSNAQRDVELAEQYVQDAEEALQELGEEPDGSDE